MENWKAIEGFEAYEVSDLGRVRRAVDGGGYKAGRLLTLFLQRDGHLRTSLCKGGKNYMRYAHVLVAKAFIPNPLNLPEVNHLGAKSDCRAVKLEWRSKAGNEQHAMRHGLKGDGVSFDKRTGKWRARCSQTYLGLFNTKEEALVVRKSAVASVTVQLMRRRQKHD